MPRRRQAPKPMAGNPNGGVPAQPIQVPTGLPYGEHKAAVEAQQAMPLPKLRDPETAALEHDFQPVGFGAPPGPAEMGPMTAGLPFGEGPGPEVLYGSEVGGRMTALLQELLEGSDSPELAQLAAIAAEQGL